MLENNICRATSLAVLASLLFPAAKLVTHTNAQDRDGAPCPQNPEVSLVVRESSALSHAQKHGIQQFNLDFSKDPFAQMSPVPIKRGEEIYKTMGCAVCHSVDGSDGIGPTWKGLWGSTGKLVDGSTYTANAAYVRESINEPAAKVKDGYAPIMPSFKEILGEKDIDEVVRYIESVSK